MRILSPVRISTLVITAVVLLASVMMRPAAGQLGETAFLGQLGGAAPGAANATGAGVRHAAHAHFSFGCCTSHAGSSCVQGGRPSCSLWMVCSTAR
jgi:hypothetical protein